MSPLPEPEPSRPMPRVPSWKGAATLMAALGLSALAGCGPSGLPATSSPIASADSEAGRKAQADDERFVKQRQELEAKARKRVRGLPTAD